MSDTVGSRIGQTRQCPHCKSRILKSAAVCPQCQHALRANAMGPAGRPSVVLQPLRVEGTVQPLTVSKPSEYSVIFTVHNDRGEELSRRVMAVGAISPSEFQKFTVWVEVYN